MNTTLQFASRLSVSVAAALPTLGGAWVLDGSTEDPAMGDNPVAVLTPTHLRQALRDIPASVTVLSADTIAAYGFLGINEVVRMVTGAGPGRLSWAHYDMSNGKKNVPGLPRVVVLIDGLEVAGPLDADGDDWSRLPVSIDDVDRIEVTRGPSASGQGRASLVAIVNIVTKHPEDVERGYARATTGSYRTFNTTARGGMSFGPAAVRLTLHHRERGAVDDVRRNDVQRFDPLSFDRMTLRTALRLADDSVLAVDAAYLSGHLSGDLNATPPLGREVLRNGYASAGWTRHLAPAHELSVRLDHWFGAQNAMPVDCEAAQEADRPLWRPAAPGQRGDACNPATRDEDHTLLKVQDVHLVTDALRLVGGVGWRQQQVRVADKLPVSWSVTAGRAFASVDWQAGPAWVFNAGLSAESDSAGGHDRSARAAANWHLSDEQTLRLAWSAGSWASEFSRRLATSGEVATRERLTAIDLGYLHRVPRLNGVLEARMFWTRLLGRAWSTKTETEQPVHGEMLGLDFRAAADLSARWSGFIGMSTMAEGASSGLDTVRQVWPWAGSLGLSASLGDGWRASVAYYASTRIDSARQTAGRADLTVLKDFRIADIRTRLVVSARRADHVSATAAGGPEPPPRTGVSSSVFASLQAAF